MKQNSKRTQNDIVNNDYIVFAIFCGIISTVWHYNYGFGDQIENIPIVMRAIDSSYLKNDFFVNVTTNFNPRYYFAHLVAWLNNFLSVPAIYFFLTLISNIFVSIISYFFSRDIFNNSKLAGLLASMFVMTIVTVNIGSVDEMFAYGLIPYRVSVPLILLSLYSAIRRHPLLIGIFSGIASIIHPLFGLGSGGILLLSLLILNFIEKKKFFKDYLPIIYSFLILLSFSLLSLIPYYNAITDRLSSKEFFGILALFRNPHHYIPSYILSGGKREAIGFFGAFLIALYLWQKSPSTTKHHAYYILTVSIIIFYLCIGGYIFVEIIPVRFWITAQTFRFLNIIKWFGLIIFAGSIANAFAKSKQKLYGYLLFASVLSPLATFIAFSSNLIEKFSKKYIPFLKYFFTPGPILILVVSCLIITRTKSNIYLYLFFFFLILAIQYKSRKIFYSTITIFLIFLLANNFYFPKIALASEFEAKLSSFFRPKFSLSDYSGDNIEIAKYIKQRTPQDAIFLTPPMFGELRLVGKRAIVVDFKAFPFLDQDMKQWKERLDDCYGKVESIGIHAARELDRNYKRITDTKIEQIKLKYNISYAVLYKQTKTNIPVLYANDTYKLVGLK